jgi:predicted N-acetyltransferase YhbS
MRSVVEICRFTREHLEAILSLCEAERWPSFPEDPERAVRVLTAPGVTTVVAIQDDHVVGFAQMLSDGEIQAFLANLAVAQGARNKGIGRALVIESLRLAGGQRVDLLSEEGATAFYSSFPHFEKPGYRLYPFHENGDRGATDL